MKIEIDFETIFKKEDSNIMEMIIKDKLMWIRPMLIIFTDKHKEGLRIMCKADFNKANIINDLLLLLNLKNSLKTKKYLCKTFLFIPYAKSKILAFSYWLPLKLKIGLDNLDTYYLIHIYYNKKGEKREINYIILTEKDNIKHIVKENIGYEKLLVDNPKLTSLILELLYNPFLINKIRE